MAHIFTHSKCSVVLRFNTAKNTQSAGSQGQHQQRAQDSSCGSVFCSAAKTKNKKIAYNICLECKIKKHTKRGLGFSAPGEPNYPYHIILKLSCARWNSWVIF